MVGHLRLCTCLALFWLVAGCGPPSVPGVLVGESTHFRLFVDPNFDLAPPPAYMQGADGLAALETDWADKQTMLMMPEGRKIDRFMHGTLRGPPAARQHIHPVRSLPFNRVHCG